MNKKIKFLIPVLLACIGLAAAGIFVIYPRLLEQKQKKQALKFLEEEEYHSIFFSMYDISAFAEEDFTVYRGVPTRRLDYHFSGASDTAAALDAVFSSGNQITNLYIGLDPLALWRSAKKDTAEADRILAQKLSSLAAQHPEISFEILFSFPSMDYLTALDETEINAASLLCQQFTDRLEPAGNVKLYYAGDQEWLLCNPANYTDDFSASPFVAQKLFLMIFCDQELQITGANAAQRLQRAAELVKTSRDAPAQYPDLSSFDIVFLGDSIVGNYSGSLSIPGVARALSGASVFNCAKGGTSAAEYSARSLCFPAMADDFAAGRTAETDGSFLEGLQTYLSADHTGRKMCFIINYGLNDYFDGLRPDNPEDRFDISTYGGAMRSGIRTLKENYPDAMYFIMGPGAVTGFENGTSAQGDLGKPLADYYALSVSLSEEMGTFYIDLYQEFPGDGATLSDVLADGCHYNEYGRFLLGQKIIFSIAANASSF